MQHGVTIDTKGGQPWPGPAAIEPKCRGDYRQSILISPGSRDPIVRLSTKVVSHTLLSLPRRRLMTLGVVGTAAWGLTLEEAAAQTIDTRHWRGTAAIPPHPEPPVPGPQPEWPRLWS